MDPTIASILGTILGALLAGPLTYYFTKKLVTRQAFNKASSDFKSAFIPELRYLDYRYSPNRPPEIGIYKTLSLAFDRHEIAVIKFRTYLSAKDIIGFDKAWEDYCNKDNSKPHFIIHAEPDGITDKIKAQKFYLEKLNNLLEFAKLNH